jgi:hypothetical protein
VQALINRFKEFRRCKKPSLPNLKPAKIVSSVSKQQPTGRMLLTVPDIPIGEDETSFTRHNKLIKYEMSKGNKKNLVVLNDLIAQSFAMRRRDILDNSYHVNITLEKYPFLKHPNQVRISHYRYNELINYDSYRFLKKQIGYVVLNVCSTLLGSCGRKLGPSLL